MSPYINNVYHISMIIDDELNFKLRIFSIGYLIEMNVYLFFYFWLEQITSTVSHKKKNVETGIILYGGLSTMSHGYCHFPNAQYRHGNEID